MLHDGGVRFASLCLVGLLIACDRGAAAPKPGPGSGSGLGSAARLGGGAGSDATPKNELPIKAAYLTYCALCHGAEGKGYAADHAPSLVNPTFLASASDDFLRRSIVFGRTGTAMAGYGKVIGGPLDDRTVQRMVGYLRELGGGIAEQPTLAVAAGNAAHGGVIYAASCLKCHGDPKTRGEALHLANPQLLQLATDGFLRHAIVNGRPGTPMEPWKDKLSEADIADVVAFVRDFAKQQVTVGQLPAPTGKEPIVINPKGGAPRFTLKEDRFLPAADVAAALAKKQKLVIIDARSPSDWMKVHIPGAISVPYYDNGRLAEVPNDDTWVLAYCACPHHASGEVVDALRKRGYKHTAVIDEGILVWQQRGYPIVAAEGVTAPPAQGAPTGLMPPQATPDIAPSPK
jgi:mono/diheme cytochrome c family protein/rhodanese-related sulfurtransferase